MQLANFNKSFVNELELHTKSNDDPIFRAAPTKKNVVIVVFFFKRVLKYVCVIN